jgi:hypothetical protein
MYIVKVPNTGHKLNSGQINVSDKKKGFSNISHGKIGLCKI